MKKITITALILSLNWPFSQGSVKDPKPLRTVEINALYSHYIQNGYNSAVTGGIGTEKLLVYAPSFSVKHNRKSNIFFLKCGTDIISSASTDNIDFVKSSASIIDARTYSNLSYSRKFKSGIFQLGTGFSMESDYFSKNATLSYQSPLIKNKIEFGLSLQSYFDDLRWGRLNPSYKRPVRLIYPSELRYKDWFENYKRNSHNLKMFTNINVNRNNRIGIYPELALQKGLLSTPFHRVYFDDGSLAVEKLPNTRLREVLGLKWNHYINTRFILKSNLDVFNDNFGIKGIAIETELPVRINDHWKLMPFIRVMGQEGAKYFKPYKGHNTSEEFYTSDYDLSSMRSIKVGFEIKCQPETSGKSKTKINFWSLRYSYYKQSNGLYAHVMVFEMMIRDKRRPL